MRIHLGHHFYGAGNLGDDFMLAGFLSALRTLAPHATYTSCVPFPLGPLRARFPAVHWLASHEADRAQCIRECDVWLGLGGSPFQSAQSRWFIDHLLADAALCQRSNKPMFYLGVGVQTAAELAVPAVQRLCATARGIWTRDATSADRLAALPIRPHHLASAADLAHLYFRSTQPPAAVPGRFTLVANFDYGHWSGQTACLHAIQSADFSPALTQRRWLAQESRALPGAERALYAALPPSAQSRWQLIVPDSPPAAADTSPPLARAAEALPLDAVLARWPSGEYLLTSRFHAAFAGAWAGSKIVIIATNEKLRGAARDLGCPMIEPDADEVTVRHALRAAAPIARSSLLPLAAQAHTACAEFVRAATPFLGSPSLPRSTVAPGASPP